VEMGHLSSQMGHQHHNHRQELEWRRSQVLTYSSEGYSIREIAQKLQIAKSSIDRDLKFLKQQANNKCDKSLESLKASEAEADGLSENSERELEEQQQQTHNGIF
jgi:transposase